MIVYHVIGKLWTFIYTMVLVFHAQMDIIQILVFVIHVVIAVVPVMVMPILVLHVAMIPIYIICNVFPHVLMDIIHQILELVIHVTKPVLPVQTIHQKMIVFLVSPQDISMVTNVLMIVHMVMDKMILLTPVKNVIKLIVLIVDNLTVVLNVMQHTF